MNELMLSGIIVGVLAMLFFTPYKMAVGISSLEGKPSFGEKLICMIPIVNIARAENKYYGKISLATISFITLVAGIVFRVWAWWFHYQNVLLGTISIVVFWLVIFFYYAANVKFVYNVIKDADALSGSKLFLFSVAYPFGQYFIGAYLANIIKHNMEQEAIFKG